MIMLVEVTLNEFRNLALLPSAKIVEHYDDAAPVVELGDSRRYVSLDINLECMDKRNEMRFLTLATHQERNENTHQEKNKTWSSRKKQDPTVKS